MQDALQHIISGAQQVSFGTSIQTVLDYLRRSQTTSKMAERGKYFKRQETEK